MQKLVKSSSIISSIGPHFDSFYSAGNLDFANSYQTVYAEKLGDEDMLLTTSKEICFARQDPKWTIRIDKYSDCQMSFGIADYFIKH